uniref:Peptidase M13 N-terminal domain-containing protein n=1 Tax=Romanomermis culicivorax TaxID=13658 RepID=A0A915J2W7_ROMCU
MAVAHIHVMFSIYNCHITFNGNAGNIGRSNFCLKKVKSVKMAIGALYVRSQFSVADKREAQKMISNLKKSLRDIFSNSNWMDDVTKRRAIEKVNCMLYLIGYPDLVLNDTALNNYYEKLQSYNRRSFIMIIPSHRYDKNGAPIDWWSPKAAQAFHRKVKCIQKQYDAFVEPLTNRHVNGKLTLGENIADNGGLKCALKGYLRYLNQTRRLEKPLPGLNLTILQTFFVNYATVQNLLDEYSAIKVVDVPRDNNL